MIKRLVISQAELDSPEAVLQIDNVTSMVGQQRRRAFVNLQQLHQLQNLAWKVETLTMTMTMIVTMTDMTVYCKYDYQIITMDYV